MTTCPHSYSTVVFGHQYHGRSQADKIRCMVLNMNCPLNNIVMVTTVSRVYLDPPSESKMVVDRGTLKVRVLPAVGGSICFLCRFAAKCLQASSAGKRLPHLTLSGLESMLSLLSNYLRRRNFSTHPECFKRILGVKSSRLSDLHYQNPIKTFQMFRKVSDGAFFLHLMATMPVME